MAGELNRRRDRDTGRVLDALAPLALDVRVGDVAVEGGVLNLAFLVEKAHVDDFDRQLEALSAELSPPIRFKLTGPLPPYSFVDVPLAAIA